MTRTVKIDGMMCGHCTARVEKALMSIDGIESVKASVENSEAVIEMNSEIPTEVIREAIENCGYTMI